MRRKRSSRTDGLTTERPDSAGHGAARGIGLATARMLMSEGANVALVDIDADACEEAADALNATSTSGRALAIPPDITAEQAVSDAFATTKRELGAVTTLIHCAGILDNKTFVDSSSADWRKMIDVFVRANVVYSCCTSRHDRQSLRPHRLYRIRRGSYGSGTPVLLAPARGWCYRPVQVDRTLRSRPAWHHDQRRVARGHEHRTAPAAGGRG